MVQVKDEGWWLVAGNPKTREVYALKRVTFLEHLNSNLVLPKHLNPDTQVCVKVQPHPKKIISIMRGDIVMDLMWRKHCRAVVDVYIDYFKLRLVHVVV